MMASNYNQIGKLRFNLCDRYGASEVFKGLYEKFPGSVSHVAIKRFKKNEDHSNQRNRPENFVRCWSDVDKNEPPPNLVRILHVEEDEMYYYVAMEKCSASLQDVFDKKFILDIQEGKQSKWLMKEIADGLLQLSTRKLVYRNINPRNILISENPTRLKFADFSVAREISPENIDVTRSSASCTKSKADWTAPEITDDQQRRYSMPADVYSAGLLFYLILTGHHPFGDCFNDRIENMLLGTDIKFEVIKDSGARHLVENMLNLDSDKRIAVRDILSHIYFYGEEQVLDFIIKLSEDLEPPKNAFHTNRNHFSKTLDGGITEIFEGSSRSKDWSLVLEGITRDLIFKDKHYALKDEAYVKESLCWLIRTIRNKWVHLKEGIRRGTTNQANSAPLWGTTAEQYHKYWTDKYPGLVLFVWTVWKNQV